VAVRRAWIVFAVSGGATAGSAPGRKGPITLDMKAAGKPGAGKRHAGFDEAGGGGTVARYETEARQAAEAARESGRQTATPPRCRARVAPRLYTASSCSVSPQRCFHCSPRCFARLCLLCQ